MEIKTTVRYHLTSVKMAIIKKKRSVGLLYVFFGKIPTRILCPFLTWIVWFFALELYEFLKL